MTNSLIIKVETTGVLKKGAKPVDSDAPRVMHIAAKLTDRAGRDMGSIAQLIRPDGWIVKPGAKDKHGITQKDCEAFGIRPRAALAVLMDMARSADELMAFNMPFVDLMIQVELTRLGGIPEDWMRAGLKRTCVMHEASHAYRGGKAISFADAFNASFLDVAYSDFGLDAVDCIAAIQRQIEFSRKR